MKLTEKEIKKILKMHEEGLSSIQIANALEPEELTAKVKVKLINELFRRGENESKN